VDSTSSGWALRPSDTLWKEEYEGDSHLVMSWRNWWSLRFGVGVPKSSILGFIRS